MEIFGQVVSGLGEGKFFVGLTPYKNKFEELTGFTPFEGTLNVKLKHNFKLDEFNPIEFDGFEIDGKTYFGGKVLLIKLFNKHGNFINCAVVAPKKTDHSKKTLEIIAPIQLRKFLSLNNSDVVKLVI
ncbi:riboflavin kinase [Methanococcus maripaludis X1]|uniref:Riboflavin kinase n=1 Tax=Methanococcus maripaludis X1 TaxID=1053692 RepID=G0H1R8_METMI|nr:CTP-dependent riboflavin kinase [Methanococcus maripaludis]AEK19075.1 riboflavin kinase [Methanococcus maripaludis X1]